MESEGNHQKSSSLLSPLIQQEEDDALRALVSNDRAETGKGVCSVVRGEVLEEVKKQLWLAGPLISVSFLLYCLQMISVMFVGHLGELSLSGASMATSFASVTGFSLLVSKLLPV